MVSAMVISNANDIIHLAQHIFTEEKGDYYEIEDGIAQTTGGKFSVQIPG